MYNRLYPFVFVLALFGSNAISAQVFINEVLASNASVNADPDFLDYSDWIELYNSSANNVDVSGWHLTDNASLPLKWTFPTGTVIPASGYLIVWADGAGTGLHTNFSLSAAGEEVALINASGTQVDFVAYNQQLTDKSYGRETDGATNWGFFQYPTPAASNGNSTFYIDFVEQVPSFWISGGFYAGPISVNIENLYGTGEMRYTTDGSEPSANSPLFTAALQITSTTVVKARMFYSNRLSGPTVTNTYFINEHFDERGLAVLSLSTNPDYFYAPDSGLYVQNFKPTWEYPIHLEFYEPDGLLGFHHDAGVQIGGENAWILPQKLLNIYSRKQYGSAHFDYQIFPNNARKRFGDLILRCSGSDWSSTIFRDGMMQGLIKEEADLDGQDFRPCAVFINGEYLGLHNIREKQDADYIEYYHGIPSDSLDYIENDALVKEGDDVAYQELVATLTAGVQTDAAFAHLDSICDTQDYCDYIISQIYTANTSWGHNISLFRKKTTDARWRWLLHDYDRGFNMANIASTGMDWATTTTAAVDWSNPLFGTLFLRKMLENNAFKQRFITRFADHLYVTYNPATINKRVDKHANWIRPEMTYQVPRWTGTTSSYGNAIPTIAYWENQVSLLKQFGVQRNVFMFSDLASFFNLSSTATLQLSVSQAAQGDILLHEMKIPSYPWSGQYFQNRNFTLHALAKPGFLFDHWEKLPLVSTTLVPVGTAWKYRDASTAPAANWFQNAYNDNTWSSGNAQLGYGDGDEATVISYGSDANNKTPSYYFRKTFDVADATAFTDLTVRIKADDGAIVYLNGNEVWRINMLDAPNVIQFSDFALSSVSGTNENAWNELVLPVSSLNNGQNVLAVEVHQVNATSSDLSFDAELLGTVYGTPEIIGSNESLDVILDANPRYLRAVFQSDGTCGILPDTLFENQTLMLACSPYKAAADVVVKSNVTLTVEPGVAIQFPAGGHLYVHGDVQMLGTEAQPITLTTTENSPSWGGVFLKNTTATSTFNYVHFEKATAGTHRFYFPAALSAYNANLHLDHLDLTQVLDNPIFTRFSDVELTNSNLKSSVTGDCINVKQGYAKVENCIFEGGHQPDMDAIDYDGVSGGIIRNNVIHDFRGDNCDGLDIGEQCQNLIIENNFIYHCFDKGISVGQQSTAQIQDNTIAYTATGIALKDQSVATVDHCTFFGNQHGVWAYEKNPGHLGGTGNITNSIVSNAMYTAYEFDAYSSLEVVNSLSDIDSISFQGTLNANPQFDNPTWYNFALLPNSPALNIGTLGSNLGAITLPVYEDQPRLLISEILYDDTLSTTGEFIEIYNPGTVSVDLSGYQLSDAIDFVFPQGASIGADQYLIIAMNMTNFSGATYPVYQWSDGKLRNEGELITFFDADGLLIDFVRYNNHMPWPEGATLLGKSIQLTANNLDNHFGTSWLPSNAQGGTPGGATWVGTSEPAQSSLQMLLYPNPSNLYVNLALKDAQNAAFLKITDASGRIVIEQSMQITMQWQIENVNVSMLSSGNYYVSLFDKNGRLLQTEILQIK